ncbi:metallophosphoesterase [Sulfurimonas sp.]|jgi:UDP-2,3-diacylglucosamine hydrolase|uniref:UDP-2,3-diacylglucosamine diphosphatase n=1 Tax=Sulfurimonas sp. TaxID=2022749 RepID=UPI0025D9BA10|nr:metallophosphoesterase [Sulfurimonas sp.]MCK9473123.1 metallophosphoesterase [Sulfurimonas sp.]MDD3505316.1 metallophosphoesterase [Sulfurimonas sp.]
MFHDLEIKDGAFVIADAHYSHKRPYFLEFLKDIYSKKLLPTQLILMGDIFDTLFGQVPYTHTVNQEAIKLINEISKTIEVIYLEGNHDFNLKNIFPSVRVFPIFAQPLSCNMQGKKVLLCHGDIQSDFSYKIYTSFIRNPLVLHLLRIIDSLTNHAILKRLDLYLGKKNDCKEFIELESFISKRVGDKFSCDYFVEGHFHQNKTLKLKDFIYVNLGAFACNQRYFIVKLNNDIQFLQEKIFSKGN